MKRYKINEIFYSLQGEGRNAGRAAVFVRFSGCNLACWFCDTDHREGVFMTADEIVGRVEEYPRGLLVLTGGEPSLFIDEELTGRFKAMGFEVAIETNGTRPLPGNIDWVTLSPKSSSGFDSDSDSDSDFGSGVGTELVLDKCEELKVVFPCDKLSAYDAIGAKYRYLQPCDTGNEAKNKEITEMCVEYVKNNPQWRISLQLHKILSIR